MLLNILKSKIHTGFMFGNKFSPEGYASLEWQHWNWAEEQQSETNWNAKSIPQKQQKVI